MGAEDVTPPPSCISDQLVAATVTDYARVPRRTRARLVLMQGWDHEKTLGGLSTPALRSGAPWVGTHSGVLGNPAAAAQQ